MAWAYIKQSMKVLGLLFLLSSCMVGPNFRTPSLPPVKQFTEKKLPAKTVQSRGPGGVSQSFLQEKDIPLLWWELYHSPILNQLVKAGFSHNPSVASASAALRQARENWRAQLGNLLLPAVDAQGSVLRQRYSALQIGVPNRAETFTLYNVGANVSYTLDIFGGARRQLESLRAQIDYQQFEEIATYLTLSANIITTAISMASYQAQIEVTRELIQIQSQILHIFQDQFRLGAVSKENILAQQTLLEQTKATLPPLQKNLQQAKHALAALVGTYPESVMPTLILNELPLPQELPISIPSRLVRQRPDIRAAEALMHSACAQVGVATANMFPQVTLLGSEGWINTSWANLFTASNNIWSISAQVLQPLFHGGALFAQRRAAVAAFQQAAAQYQQTVLQAFQNVADVLTALKEDASTLQAQSRAEETARASLQLTLKQYRLGATNYLNLLNAQQQYQQTRINRIQTQALRYSDTAALFQALGGGWWHKPWCVKECL